jgi:hypothetical protein
MTTAARARTLLPSLAFTLAACGGGETSGPDAGPSPDGGAALEVPDRYAFTGREGAASSVAYGGQVFRLVLIEELKAHVGRLTARIDQGYTPAEGEVAAELGFFLDFDPATSGEVALTLETSPARLQRTYADLSAKGAKLADKLAGNDPIGQHRDWNTAGVVGWPGNPSPEALVRGLFATLDRQAVARGAGQVPSDPAGQPLASVALTERGHDVAELLQKFLHGAIAFSQAADDYLDDDLDGKGLRSDHARVEEGQTYTALEHAWDEGFGYLGAPRDMGDYTDEELAGAGGRPAYARGQHDTDDDGAIDLGAEHAFLMTRYAARRDLASKSGLDLTSELWAAFRTGRAIIARARGPLDAADEAALAAERDRALVAWERAIAATCISYLNRVIGHVDRLGAPDYSFAEHAKHWSELKGLALAFQFNRRSPLGAAELAELHEKLGDGPFIPLPGGSVEVHRRGLLEARAILRGVYGFSEADVGDDRGQGGW